MPSIVVDGGHIEMKVKRPGLALILPIYGAGKRLVLTIIHAISSTDRLFDRQFSDSLDEPLDFDAVRKFATFIEIQ